MGMPRLTSGRAHRLCCRRARVVAGAGRPVTPQRTGVIAIDDVSVADLVDTIDWTPFFRTWELAGRFPAILEDPVVGETATELHQDAQAMLAQIIEEGWLTPRGLVGLFPAVAQGDDIHVFDPTSCVASLARLSSSFSHSTHNRPFGSSGRDACSVPTSSPSGDESCHFWYMSYTVR